MRLKRIIAHVIALEGSGRFAWSLLLADFLACNLVLAIFYAYSQKRAFDPEQSSLVAGGVVFFNLLSFTYTRKEPRAFCIILLRTLGAGILAILFLPLIAKLEGGLGSHDIRTAIAFCIPLAGLLRFIHTRTASGAPLEALRYSIIGVGGLTVSFPFLTTFTVGTGDAYWYGNMVGDFVQQWRAGIFPVFVGQSDYAFNGAVNPLRYAPYLQHAAGVLDLLTFRSLSNAGLINLILVCSISSTVFITYLCLAIVTTANRWISCLLALSFVGSPAVLSLAYTGDLFMSVCALPYLPLIFFSIWRTFRDQDLRSMFLLAIPLAAAWLCHPPIAFWAVIIAALSQILRLAGKIRRFTAWRDALVGGGIFIALTAGAFVSVFTVGLPALNAEPPLIVKALVDAFPSAFLPVSEGANNLSDYQLGWSLWWTLLIGLIMTLSRPRAFTVSLALACLLLLALLMPIPQVLEILWIRILPQTVANITFLWPMQRFYVLLAVITVFLGSVACSRLVRGRSWMNLPLIGALVAGLCWSGSESILFLQRGVLITETALAHRIAQLPENRVLTRYAYSPFPVVPPYFSHSYIDPTWENRLLDISSLKEVNSNYKALSSSSSIIRASGQIAAKADAPGASSFVLLRDIPLEAGRYYALEFEFSHPDIAGTLLAKSSTLARNYLLPNSGTGIATSAEPEAFGSLSHSKKSFPLHISTGQSQKLETVQFWASAPLERNIEQFGSYKLKEYEPSSLPIVVESWIPYRAHVSTKTPVWLETPKMFIGGYRAQINGVKTIVSRSPTGLVMVPLAAGENQVIVDYPGSISLRASYFFSLASWICVFAVGIRTIRRPLRSILS